MELLNQRIQILEKASKGINPTETAYKSSVNDALTSLRDDELIRFKPQNIVNPQMEIEITDAGMKRLDEMKRSKFPPWLTFGIPAAGIALLTLIYKFSAGV